MRIGDATVMIDTTVRFERDRLVSVSISPEVAGLLMFAAIQHQRQQAHARVLRDGLLVKDDTFKQWATRQEWRARVEKVFENG